MQVPLLDLSKIVYLHSTRSSMMMDFAQHLADDDDIWHTLEQPAASVAAKPICTAFELTIEVCIYVIAWMPSRSP